MDKICVLGAGSWGTAQAVLLSAQNEKVYIWGRPQDGIEDMAKERENRRFLPGIALPGNVIAEADAADALRNANMVVLAVPAQTLRGVLRQMAHLLPAGAWLVNTAKGLEIDSGMRMSQVLIDVLGHEARERYAVLSGPSHAEEVGQGIPTAVTVAAFKRNTAVTVQDAYMTPAFRVYTHPDVAGVELGGALKNIVALATGVCDGLGYGDNTRAALMTRGLTEMTRMGVALGGDVRTFNGLSGMGDLVVTCGSRHSRNHRAGCLIASGYNLEQVLDKIGMVVEGIHTTRVVYRIASEMKVDMPICQACYGILYEDRSPLEEVDHLMTRQKKHEVEESAGTVIEW